jgi:hypothetical protein
MRLEVSLLLLFCQEFLTKDSEEAWNSFVAHATTETRAYLLVSMRIRTQVSSAVVSLAVSMTAATAITFFRE